ncbi:MAG TPA: diacylglycerol kinase family protein [Gemmatimonadaceae bacterium]|nr:diacylglycerol kinase family protein [Gemmatimonadaceae bacterium]
MTGGVCVIVNPASGRGRGTRALPDIRRTFAAVGVTDIRVTAAKGDERRVARRAIDDGCSTIIAVGGDGTWSNVANAILESGADVRLGLLAMGTGNDFAKTVGAPARDLQATARLAVEGHDLRVDVGRIEDHYFLNVAGFGFDIAVLEDIERITWLRGDALYMYSALRQLFGYPGIEIDIRSERHSRGASPHLMLIVANARNFGGSFRIAPDASLTDGRLDAISIGNATPMRRLSLFGAATRGTHTRHREVITEQAKSFTLRFPTPPAYETDGEYRRAQTNELEIRCVPAALRVITPGPELPSA